MRSALSDIAIVGAGGLVAFAAAIGLVWLAFGAIIRSMGVMP